MNNAHGSKKLTGKEATRMILVNWGPFEQPDIISLSDLTMFVGSNGSGKTMSMDAIGFCLYGITDFNASAKKEGEQKKDRRTLPALLHGSTKDPDRPYLRPDEVISWCIIEFFDHKNGRYFLCGQVSESKDIRTYKTWRFVIDDCRLEEFRFRSEDGLEIYSRNRCLCKGLPVKLDVFQETGNGLKQIARALGIQGNYTKIANTVRRMMALNPEANVSQFIAESILEFKEGQGDILKSLRKMQDNYTAAAIELERVEKERAMLVQADEAAEDYIKKKTAAIKEDMRLAYKNSYMVGESITSLKQRKAVEEGNLTIRQDDVQRADKKWRASVEECANIEKANGLSDINAVRKVKEDGIRTLQEEEAGHVKKETDLKKFRLAAKEALTHFRNDPEAGRLMIRLDDFSGENGRSVFASLASFKSNKIDGLRKNKYDAERERHIIAEELSEIREELRKLEANTLVFPRVYESERARIQDYFKRKGVDVPVKFAVELVREIKDPSWQRAIESYLRNNRFCLIIPPEYEDAAFNFVKREKLHHTSVFMSSLPMSTEAKEGTAAAMLDIINNDAKKFFVRVLGGVWLADTEQDVKGFARENKASITRDGTRSSGFARSVSKPVDVLYIGKDVVARRIADLKEKHRNKTEEEAKLARKIKSLEGAISAIDKLYFDYEKYDFDASKKLADVRIAIVEAKKDLEAFKAETADITKAYNKKREERDHLFNLRDEAMQKKINTESEIRLISESIAAKEQEAKDAKEKYDNLCSENPDYEYDIEEEAAADKRRIPFYSVSQVTLNNANTARDQAFNEMVFRQARYYEMRGETNVNLKTGEGSINELKRVYSQLNNVRFEECKEAVRKQKERLRRSLIQDFIARVGEQIDNAHKEKNRRNHTLDKLSFGQQKYRFVIERNEEGAMGLFYRIYDDLKRAMSPEALISMLDEDVDLNDAVMSFLDVILEWDDSSEYTDYRNYLTCDMDIIEEKKNMKYRLTSKQSQSSTGEQQTPYLIILIASLSTLFQDDSATKLCLMDEAFAAWDTDRIDRMIEYFKENGFQVIFAAPDKQYATLGKYMTSFITCIKATSSPYSFLCDGRELLE